MAAATRLGSDSARRRQLQQAHGPSDFFLAADKVHVVPFVEDVIGWRVGDDRGIAADSDDAGSGAFADTKIGKRLTVGLVPDFDFKGLESDFRWDRKFFDGSSTKHFVSPLAHGENRKSVVVGKECRSRWS